MFRAREKKICREREVKNEFDFVLSMNKEIAFGWIKVSIEH